MNNKIHYKQLYNYYFQDDAQLKDVEWPRSIQGLTKVSRIEVSKLRKLKSISETKLAGNEEDKKEENKNIFRETSFKVIEEPSREEEGQHSNESSFHP
jgi:hypothetical protein